jgi:hypothetical protein
MNRSRSPAASGPEGTEIASVRAQALPPGDLVGDRIVPPRAGARRYDDDAAVALAIAAEMAASAR